MVVISWLQQLIHEALHRSIPRQLAETDQGYKSIKKRRENSHWPPALDRKLVVSSSSALANVMADARVFLVVESLDEAGDPIACLDGLVALGNAAQHSAHM